MCESYYTLENNFADARLGGEILDSDVSIHEACCDVLDQFSNEIACHVTFVGACVANAWTTELCSIVISCVIFTLS